MSLQTSLLRKDYPIEYYKNTMIFLDLYVSKIGNKSYFPIKKNHVIPTKDLNVKSSIPPSSDIVIYIYQSTIWRETFMDDVNLYWDKQ